MSVICFHNPKEQNGYLSNWYKCSFKAGSTGMLFSSVEQYMMWYKATMFNDKPIANAILSTNDVAKIKALGRQVHDYNDSVWSEERYNCVRYALYEKFSQNLGLAKQLLSTGDAILCECAVKDVIWGIGLSMTDPDRLNPEKWRGQNLLGKALMEVREMLRVHNSVS
jgi:hypothetical protein